MYVSDLRYGVRSQLFLSITAAERVWQTEENEIVLIMADRVGVMISIPVSILANSDITVI